SMELKRSIRFYTADSRYVGFDQKGRNHLNSTTDKYCDNGKYGEDDRFVFKYSVVPSCVSRSYILPGKRCSFSFFIGNKASCISGLDQVVSHNDGTDEIEASANGSQSVQRQNLNCGFEEIFVNQETFRIKLFPHQALHHT